MGYKLFFKDSLKDNPIALLESFGFVVLLTEEKLLLYYDKKFLDSYNIGFVIQRAQIGISKGSNLTIRVLGSDSKLHTWYYLDNKLFYRGSTQTEYTNIYSCGNQMLYQTTSALYNQSGEKLVDIPPGALFDTDATGTKIVGVWSKNLEFFLWISDLKSGTQNLISLGIRDSEPVSIFLNGLGDTVVINFEQPELFDLIMTTPEPRIIPLISGLCIISNRKDRLLNLLRDSIQVHDLKIIPPKVIQTIQVQPKYFTHADDLGKLFIYNEGLEIYQYQPCGIKSPITRSPQDYLVVNNKIVSARNANVQVLRLTIKNSDSVTITDYFNDYGDSNLTLLNFKSKPQIDKIELIKQNKNLILKFDSNIEYSELILELLDSNG